MINLTTPKKLLIAVLTAALLFVVGYGAGKYATPAKVVEKEHVVLKDKIVEVESTEATNKIHALEQQVEHYKRDSHRVTITVQKPDGTVVTNETEDTHTEDTKAKVADVTSDFHVKTDSSKTEDIDLKIDKSKVIIAEKPQWHVGVLVGLNPSFVPLSAGELQLGVEVEHRFIGPFFLGLGATASPTKFNGVQVFVKVGLEFQ